VADYKGCTATGTVTVSQAPVVSVAATLDRGATCAGTGIAFASVTNGVSPFQFSWSPGGSTFQQPVNLDATTYTVRVTDNLGCTATTKVSISQSPVLTANIDSYSCSNNLTTANVGVKGGSAPYLYSWNPGGGTNATMSGLANGSYTITATDKLGCSATVSQTFSCTVAPGRNEGNRNNTPDCCPDNGIQIAIGIYPNPNSGQFTIAGLSNGMLIEVYDYTGRRISNITASDNTMQFNLLNQANGIYLLRVVNADGTLVSRKKVVKTN
jgi:hypothetical protein